VQGVRRFNPLQKLSNFDRLICYKSVIQTLNNLSADRQPKGVKMKEFLFVFRTDYKTLPMGSPEEVKEKLKEAPGLPGAFFS
jgi:hypothetical protein